MGNRIRRVMLCAAALTAMVGLGACSSGGSDGTGPGAGPTGGQPTSASPPTGQPGQRTGTQLRQLLPAVNGYSPRAPETSGDTLTAPSRGEARLPVGTSFSDCAGTGWDNFGRYGNTQFSPASLGVLDQLDDHPNAMLRATGMTAFAYSRQYLNEADYDKVYGAGIYQFVDAATATTNFTALTTYIAACSKYPTGTTGNGHEMVSIDQSPVGGHPAIAGHMTVDGMNKGLGPIEAFFLLVDYGGYLVGAVASAVPTKDGVVSVTAPTSPTLTALVDTMQKRLG